MLPLRKVIAAVRREIDAALDQPPNPAATARPDRIVLFLPLHFQESGPNHDLEVFAAVAGARTSAAASTPPPGVPTLTLEFTTTPVSSRPAPQNDGARAGSASSRDTLTGESAQAVIEIFSTLFGPPGFDSSARASVFREALAGLPETSVPAVVASLSGAPLAEPDPASNKARHLLSGVLQSGPLKSVEDGAAILADLFARHSPGALLRLVECTWKTQTDWL